MESAKIIESANLYNFLYFASLYNERQPRTRNEGQENHVPQETSPNA